MTKEPGEHEARGLRASDGGPLCWLALRGSQFFDWIDKRQIDAWGVLAFSLWMTWLVLDWAMGYAERYAAMDGLKIAAIIGAVVGPWVTMQAALVKFYFDARRGSFSPAGGSTAP